MTQNILKVAYKLIEKTPHCQWVYYITMCRCRILCNFVEREPGQITFGRVYQIVDFGSAHIFHVSVCFSNYGQTLK